MDTEQYFLSNTGYILTSKTLSYRELSLLCDLLNSHISLYQLDHICTKFDETGWRWLRQFVEEIRLPKSLNDWIIAFGFSEAEIQYIVSKYKHVIPD